MSALAKRKTGPGTAGSYADRHDLDPTLDTGPRSMVEEGGPCSWVGHRGTFTFLGIERSEGDGPAIAHLRDGFTGGIRYAHAADVRRAR